MKKTVLSGAQATGSLHLGNYLGSIINWIKMQDDFNCYFFLADLHAITIDRSPTELRSSILQTAALYIACGLSPEKTIIFAQSMVKEHAELAWILNCVTPIGWLKRMTQFKDKAGAAQENASLGLFSYPVLMTADILLYKADIVPVGDDQKQHLELARDIAAVINRKFDKEVLKVPEPLIQGSGARIMSLKDGRKKMSKSDLSDLSRINLTDNESLIYQKIKKAKTDLITDITYDRITRPEVSNLLDIYSTLSAETIEVLVNRYQQSGFACFKKDLAEIIVTRLKSISIKYTDLMQNQDYLLHVLKSGADKAREQASKTVAEVKELFGFFI